MDRRRWRLVEQVMERYLLMDAAAARVAVETGLRCPAGCAICCSSQKVEVTVLEMMPMAARLWEEGRADRVLEEIRAATDAACVLRLAQTGPFGGGCSMYPWRPTLCRLFGYAARVDKRGALELVTCRVHASMQPVETARARGSEAAQRAAITFGEAARSVEEIDPAIGWRLLPINAALEAALERWTWTMALDSGE